MYVVVRTNMTPGAKACQAAHALRQYAQEYPMIESSWWAKSNTLVLLEAKDEAQLEYIEWLADDHQKTCVRFVEPDWAPDGTLTALCLGPDAKHIVKDLPLAYTYKKS